MHSYLGMDVDFADMPSLAVPDSGRRREGRGGSVALFFVAGALAMVSARVMPFDPLAALPFAIVSWPLATLAGYRIWRQDHPNDSAKAAVRQRVGLYTRAVLVAGVLM